jgi:prepilin-type N-terminal cleavage/methylation domain-containing protein
MLRAPSRGYSLVELIVAVGLFSMVMTIATGAYLIMISANRQAQSISTGINNLSYALEDMTRGIRTGSGYACSNNSITFKDVDAKPTMYELSGTKIRKSTNGGLTWSDLTDPAVTVTTLLFTCTGTKPYSLDNDITQAHVTIQVSGSVSAGAGRPAKSFNVETGATMRGSDL